MDDSRQGTGQPEPQTRPLKRPRDASPDPTGANKRPRRQTGDEAADLRGADEAWDAEVFAEADDADADADAIAYADADADADADTGFDIDPDTGLHPAQAALEQWAVLQSIFDAHVASGTLYPGPVIDILDFIASSAPILVEWSDALRSEAGTCLFGRVIASCLPDEWLTHAPMLQALARCLEAACQPELEWADWLPGALQKLCAGKAAPGALDGLQAQDLAELASCLDVALACELLAADRAPQSSQWQQTRQAFDRMNVRLAQLDPRGFDASTVACFFSCLNALLSLPHPPVTPGPQLGRAYRVLYRCIAEGRLQGASSACLSAVLGDMQAGLSTSPPLLHAQDKDLTEAWRRMLDHLIDRPAQQDPPDLLLHALRGMCLAVAGHSLPAHDPLLTHALDTLMPATQPLRLPLADVDAAASAALWLVRLCAQWVLPHERAWPRIRECIAVLGPQLNLARGGLDRALSMLAAWVEATTDWVLHGRTAMAGADTERESITQWCQQLYDWTRHALSTPAAASDRSEEMRERLDLGLQTLAQRLQAFTYAIGRHPAARFAQLVPAADECITWIKQCLARVGSDLQPERGASLAAPLHSELWLDQDPGLRVIDPLGHTIHRLPIDCAVWRTLLPHAAPPVLMQMPWTDSADALAPSTCRVDGRPYRFDLAGRAKMQDERLGGRGAPSLHVGLPCDAAQALYGQWLHSMESQQHLQRAFVPELVLSGTDARVHGAEGGFEVHLFADQEDIELFAPDSPLALLRTCQGFGFVHEDVAARLGLKASGDRPRDHATRTHRPRIDELALQHYAPSLSQKESIVQDAVALARRRLLAQGEPWIDALGHRLADESLFDTLVTGGIDLRQPLAVPVRGDRLLLADDDATQAFAHEGVLIGQPPYDQPRLRFMDRRDIACHTAIAEACTADFTLTGFVQQSPVGCSLQGVLMIVPRAAWPDAYAKYDLLLSAQDMRLCTEWTTQETRDAHRRCSVSGLQIQGRLVLAQRSRPLAGVPVKLMQAALGGRYGEPIDLLSAADAPRLAKFIGAHGPVATPPAPEGFTPRYTLGLAALPDAPPMLSTWRAIHSIYGAASPGERRKIDLLLAIDHVLCDIPEALEARKQWLPGPSASAFNAGEWSDERRAQVTRAERSLGLQVASGALTVGPQVAARLAARGQQILGRLRHRFRLDTSLCAQGLRERLQQWSSLPPGSDALMQVLERHANRLRVDAAQEGLVPETLHAVLRDLLNRACASGGLMKGFGWHEALDMAASLPALRHDEYRRSKIEAMASSLHLAALPEPIDPLRLARLLAAVDGAAPMYQPLWLALAKTWKRLQIDPFRAMTPEATRYFMAELLASVFDPVTDSAPLPKGLAKLLKRWSSSPAWQEHGPLILRLAQGPTPTLAEWQHQLLDLLGGRVVDRQGQALLLDLRSVEPALVMAACTAAPILRPGEPIDLWLMMSDARRMQQGSKPQPWNLRPDAFRLTLFGNIGAVGAALAKEGPNPFGAGLPGLRARVRQLDTDPDSASFVAWMRKSLRQVPASAQFECDFRPCDLLSIKHVLLKPELQPALLDLAHDLCARMVWNTKPPPDELDQIRQLMAELVAGYFESMSMHPPARGALALLAMMQGTPDCRKLCPEIMTWWLWQPADRPRLLSALLKDLALAHLDRGVLDLKDCSFHLGRALCEDQWAERRVPLTLRVPHALAEPYRALAQSLPAPQPTVTTA